MYFVTAYSLLVCTEIRFHYSHIADYIATFYGFAHTRISPCHNYYNIVVGVSILNVNIENNMFY